MMAVSFPAYGQTKKRNATESLLRDGCARLVTQNFPYKGSIFITRFQVIHLMKGRECDDTAILQAAKQLPEIPAL